MDIKVKVINAQRKIIDSLAACEIRIGALYEKYAALFPEMNAKWLSLADTERVHSDLLKTLHRILDKGNTFYNLGRFTEQAIQPMVSLIDNSHKDADRMKLSSIEAITTALQIESSILNSHFYDVVASDAPEFRIIAARLAADTKQHADDIRSYFQSLGRSPAGTPADSQ